MGRQLEHPAAIGEEQQLVQGVANQVGKHRVVALGGGAADATTPTMLGTIRICRHALDVAAVGDRDEDLLLLNQVLDAQLVAGGGQDLGAALVAVCLLELDQVLADHAQDLGGVRKQVLEIGDALGHVAVLILDLLPLQGR